MPDGLSQRATRRLAQAVAAVATAATGTANALTQLAAGVSISTVLRATTPVSVGVAVAQAPTLLTVPTVSGVGVLPVFTGGQTASAAAGVSVATVLRSAAAELPAAKIGPITYSLVATPKSTAAGSGSPGFTNPANAASPHDGVFATLAGSLTAANTGTVVETYPAQSNRGLLLIQKVVLRYWYKIAGTSALTSPTVTGGYTPNGGALVQLFSDAAVTVAVDFTATPREFDITSVIAGQWANVAALTSTMTASIPATVNSGVTVSVDAIEMVVTASYVDGDEVPLATSSFNPGVTNQSNPNTTTKLDAGGSAANPGAIIDNSLKTTFIVPASGKVIVDLSFFTANNTTTMCTGIRTVGQTSLLTNCQRVENNTGLGWLRALCRFTLSGLTPGASMQIEPVIGVDPTVAGGTVNVYAGNLNGDTSLVVWASQ